ncbi:MFS transporter [Embleya sp. NBC_00896]|uniref:MFS transporter n=1 Tax=Embleya sp. NBC_00896 TaxID=2975961 RepID=UPI00386AFF7C
MTGPSGTPEPSPAADPAHAPGAVDRSGVVVAVLAFCGVVVALMQTLVVPLLPSLPHLLDTSPANASWVVTATLLSGAVCTPVMGRLGDMFGKRRILVVSLGLMVAGSVLCALSDALLPMVLGRFLQGASFGVIPLGISIMRDELPPAKLGSSIALMSATLGIGGAIGLPVAALIAQNADWHMMFWAAGAIGALDIALVLLLVPESSVRLPGRFDFAGAAGLSVGLVALLLAITKGADWGWSGPITLGLFGLAVVVLLVWGRLELRTAQPLVDLRISAKPQVLFTNLASIVVGFAMFAQSLVFPQVLMNPESTGYGLGKSMVVAGLCMAPSGIVMMLISPLSARLSAARGPKVSLMVGTVVIAIGYALSVFMLDALWKIVAMAVLSAVGVALAYAAMPSLIMQAVPIGETGSATGLNTLMRSIGTSTSSAVIGVVLADMTMRADGREFPSHDAFVTALWLGCGAAVIGLLVAVFIPGRKPVEAAHIPAHNRNDDGAIVKTSP